MMDAILVVVVVIVLLAVLLGIAKFARGGGKRQSADNADTSVYVAPVLFDRGGDNCAADSSDASGSWDTGNGSDGGSDGGGGDGGGGCD